MNYSDKNKKIPKIELLGIGSAKNRELKLNLEKALAELEVEAPIIEVKNIQDFLRYDINAIPALVINDKVIFQKVVPDKEELKIVLNLLLKDAESQFQIKNILVPTDFSAEAKNTLNYALALAKILKAKVDVVHIVSTEVELNIFPIGSKEDPSKVVHDAEISLQQFTEKVSKRQSVLLNEVQIHTGMIAEELLQMSSQTDLIVLGAKGSGGGIGKWFGSVASTVARKAKCPVLVVPKKARFNGLNRIVYASDFHPSEEKTLPKIVSFGNQFGATIHFVHVVQNNLNGYMVDSEWMDKRFQLDNAPFLMSSVECDEVGEGLNRFAKNKRADLMVMTTGKRRFFEELFHKSMTQKMIYNTRIPLLVMHFEDE